jgi:hypothetical protein
MKTRSGKEMARKRKVVLEDFAREFSGESELLFEVL